MPFDRDELKRRLSALAETGVYLGTSSWKYGGWRGLLYDDARYVYRGRFAETRFERLCLTEYAEVFKTVCVDAAYYSFPTEKYLKGLAGQVPADFRFGFKVTDDITMRRFPNLDRFGHRAGTTNGNFLSANRFMEGFLKPCESIRAKVGILMFEFSRFHASDYERGADFIDALDGFLGKLPKGWPYGVEMRNRTWLVPEYFACLARHGVTHVFNSWEAMPEVAAQMAMEGSRTRPDLAAARLLLKPGRRYEEAVKLFQPYNQVREPQESVREAGRALVKEGQKTPGRATFIYVNNRLEGNALETITALT